MHTTFIILVRLMNYDFRHELPPPPIVIFVLEKRDKTRCTLSLPPRKSKTKNRRNAENFSFLGHLLITTPKNPSPHFQAAESKKIPTKNYIKRNIHCHLHALLSSRDPNPSGMKKFFSQSIHIVPILYFSPKSVCAYPAVHSFAGPDPSVELSEAHSAQKPRECHKKADFEYRLFCCHMIAHWQQYCYRLPVVWTAARNTVFCHSCPNRVTLNLACVSTGGMGILDAGSWSSMSCLFLAAVPRKCADPFETAQGCRSCASIFYRYFTLYYCPRARSHTKKAGTNVCFGIYLQR